MKANSKSVTHLQPHSMADTDMSFGSSGNQNTALTQPSDLSTLVSSGDEDTAISNMSGRLDCPTVETHTAEPTLPYLIDKVTDIAIANQDAGLLIAGAIGTSAVLYVVADAAAKLIKVLRSGNQA